MHPPPFNINDRLSDWPECRIETRCPGCGWMSVPLVKLLLGKLGDVTFAELLPRIVCKHCRGRPAPVYLLAGLHGTFCHGGQPDWSLELIPPPRSVT